MSFVVGPDISGAPAIRLQSQSGRTATRFYKTCMTWLGAYWGAFWRNRLGRFYVPISPVRRDDLRRLGKL